MKTNLANFLYVKLASYDSAFLQFEDIFPLISYRTAFFKKLALRWPESTGNLKIDNFILGR